WSARGSPTTGAGSPSAAAGSRSPRRTGPGRSGRWGRAPGRTRSCSRSTGTGSGSPWTRFPRCGTPGAAPDPRCRTMTRVSDVRHVLVLPDRDAAEEVAEALGERLGVREEPRLVRDALAGEDDAE